jgi:hypothetical protein
MDSTIAQTAIGGMVGQQTQPVFNGSQGKLKLMSSPANETADGTEINGGSYVAGGVPFTLSSTWGAPSYSTGVAQVTNSGAAITQTNMPAVTSVTYASIWDTGGTPKRWWWGILANAVTTNLGDTLTFATSAVTAQMAV